MRENNRIAGNRRVPLRWLLALAVLGGLLAFRFLWPSGRGAVQQAVFGPDPGRVETVFSAVGG